MAQKDDLEAVRSIVAALDGFPPEEQDRILRWSREKIKLPTSSLTTTQAATSGLATHQAATIAPVPVVTGQPTSRDLRTFVAEKKPKTDTQFAATVAYYYRFEAPEGERKSEIVPDDLRDSCRLANRERLTSPLQTLKNARSMGLLDSPARGTFAINAVGENLVAMTLPSDGNGGTSAIRKKLGKKTAQKKAARKKGAAKKAVKK